MGLYDERVDPFLLGVLHSAIVREKRVIVRHE